jgi:hypothetical protein
MSQKYKIEFEIDGSALFDAVQKVGQEVAGARFLQTMLQVSTGKLTLRDHVALELYGITASDVLKVDSEVSL